MVDKFNVPDCKVSNYDDSVSIPNTISFDLEDKYNFRGLDDNIGNSKRVSRSFNHAVAMKPDDDAPEFRG